MLTPAGSRRVAVLGPDPLLSVTIEADGSARDEVHVHAAGQGVWVSTMAAELGAHAVLCGLGGGETGALIRATLGDRLELRLVETTGRSGSYVVDRRSGKRQLVAFAPRPAPDRHEIDDLVSVTVTAALSAAVLVIGNPFPADGFPAEVYERVLADVAGAGVPVIVDLSSPRLERTLPYRPDLVKLNDWELAEYVRGPVDGELALAAARRVTDAGARAVIVTRAGAPALVVAEDGAPYEIVPSRFPSGFHEGTGDAMAGAIAAGLARGESMRDALVLGAAAGAGNFLRHGLGTGQRAVVEDLAALVEVRPHVPTDPRQAPLTTAP